jgi:hypothetical protein
MAAEWVRLSRPTTSFVSARSSATTPLSRTKSHIHIIIETENICLWPVGVSSTHRKIVNSDVAAGRLENRACLEIVLSSKMIFTDFLHCFDTDQATQGYDLEHKPQVDEQSSTRMAVYSMR